MARTIENKHVNLIGLYALRFCERVDIIDRRRIKIDNAFGIARANGDFVHIDVGRVEQRAGGRHGHHGNRAGHVFGAKCGAF